MTSKQILLLPFLALVLVFADSQTPSGELSQAELDKAMQENLCENVTHANETRCLYKATEPVSFKIKFTTKSKHKCLEFGRRLSSQTGIEVTSMRCNDDSKYIKVDMFVDKLQQVCKRKMARRRRIKVQELREAGVDYCLPLCSEFGIGCIPGLTECRCPPPGPLPDCPESQKGCTPGKEIKGYCKCVGPSPEPATSPTPTSQTTTSPTPTSRQTDESYGDKDDNNGKGDNNKDI